MKNGEITVIIVKKKTNEYTFDCQKKKSKWEDERCRSTYFKIKFKGVTKM